MFSEVIQSRAFALITLLATLVSVGLLYTLPQLGGLPLILALAPALARVVAGLFPVPRTAVDGWIVLLLAGLAIALPHAPDAALAREKAWLIVGGVALFYALAAQNRASIWPATFLTTLFAPALGLLYLMTHSWAAEPAKFAVIQRLALMWENARPTIAAPFLHPNIAAGPNAVFLPLLIALLIHGWRRRQVGWLVVTPPAIAISAITLLFTTSRGGWLALGGGLAMWALFGWSGYVARRFERRQGVIFATILVVIGVQILAGIALFPGGLIGLLAGIPGPNQVGSRLDLIEAGLQLIRDYGLLGAGPGAFGGLYSFYIHVSSFYLFGHAHNLWLDVFLELGVLGGVGLTGIVVTTFWHFSRPNALDQAGERRRRRRDASAAAGRSDAARRPQARSSRRRSRTLLRGATLAAFTTLLLHGLVDDPFFGSRSVAFMLVPSGLAAALAHVAKPWRAQLFSALPVLAPLAVALMIALAAPAGRTALQSAWQTNSVAIDMARVELAGFGQGNRVRWDDGTRAAELAPFEAPLQRLVAANPQNGAALFRLGRVYMVQWQHERALPILEQAHAVRPNHAGMRQILGYAQLWTGDVAGAEAALRLDAQTAAELRAYERQWNRAEMPELAAYARGALAYFENRRDEP